MLSAPDPSSDFSVLSEPVPRLHSLFYLINDRTNFNILGKKEYHVEIPPKKQIGIYSRPRKWSSAMVTTKNLND